MNGSKPSKAALIALYGVKQARGIKKFSKDAKVHIRTVQKVANGGYVSVDIVRKIEQELNRREQETATPAQAIIYKVAEAKGVTVDLLLTEKTMNRYGVYSDAELARYIAVHLIYKETRLSYRQIAAEVGYKDHTSVIACLRRIGDLYDTNPIIRRGILSIQKSL